MQQKLSRDSNWNYGAVDTLRKTSRSSLCFCLCPFKSESAPSLLPPLRWQVDLRLTEDERTRPSPQREEKRFSLADSSACCSPHGWSSDYNPGNKFLGRDYWKCFNLSPFSLLVRDNGSGSCWSVSAAERDQPAAAAWIGPYFYRGS